MTKPERRELAKNYGQVLALAQEAMRRGLDKKPRTQAALRYSRLNILAHAMSVEIYREASDASPEAIEKYYVSHKTDFELYSVERIFIPRERQGQTKPLDETQQGNSPSSEGEMKILAEGTYARALAGDDFTALQEKVFQAAGINSQPAVGLEIGRGTLPAAQHEVLDLAPGKVSSLLTEAAGYYIYKMVSKRTPAFDSIREQVEIKRTNHATAEAMNRIQKQAQAKVNDAYFDKYDPPPPDPYISELYKH
jgi:hypothetical protein